MRLINPGPGELADRLAILTLKIAHGREADKDVTHFVTERNALLVKLRGVTLDSSVEHLFELTVVNAMLWHAEDDLRGYRETGQTGDNQDRIVETAFRIQELNDRRALLVGTLNKLAGSDLGPEKLS